EIRKFFIFRNLIAARSLHQVGHGFLNNSDTRRRSNFRTEFDHRAEQISEARRVECDPIFKDFGALNFHEHLTVDAPDRALKNSLDLIIAKSEALAPRPDQLGQGLVSGIAIAILGAPSPVLLAELFAKNGPFGARYNAVIKIENVD